MMKMSTVAAFAALVSHAATAAVPLPALGANAAEVSVSGLSAGGFMAVQLHVAYSATFKRGAGVVAGGPYYCAEGSIVNATGRCMTHATSIPVSSLVSTTNSWAASGLIDPVSNLSTSKVYLFSGTSDNTVKQAVMNDLKTYYQSFVPAANTYYKNNLGSGHAMITDDYGGSCGTTATPYINNCGFDLAGDILQYLYGPLNARNNGTLSGTFTEFNQTDFISGHGMAATGWVYVPQSCSSTSCRVHVVLHGCKQNYTDIGDKYVRNTGYNRWADTNNIVLIYPQTSRAATNSCFDWWGYDNANYAKKSGPQMVAIKGMVDRVVTGTSGGGGGGTALPAPTGVGTSGATASSMVIGWNGVSGAAGYNVYRSGGKVNASPVAGTNYTDTGLAASTTYNWSVTTVDAGNVESAMSGSASGTTLAGSGGGTPTCYTASNYAHTTAGRATQSGGYTYAKGSNQNMGLWNTFITTTLKQTSPNYYVIGTC
ncbi:PHB depolymerase family esterase [Variovorax sp. J22P240]|uniref:extracellular catalytic domain type 2 short-chain-length polyhydroxyalkanoate depolymerase n=1 Tax=Variovorax sp. J22P240 TaxID=3053514 RepID=UPI0025748FF5|nr:PHB depolymerase family esterase [Variovorax sp. J22P240]MDL9998294.1 PHB depolymerase family esterase [Variovorax sp. J22P240]